MVKDRAREDTVGELLLVCQAALVLFLGAVSSALVLLGEWELGVLVASATVVVLLILQALWGK